MTYSNRITLWIFLPTTQLSKLMDVWVNLNGDRAWGPQGCRQWQKTSAWVSKRVMVARSEDRCERAITSEWTRIAAREEWCPQGSLPTRIRDNSRSGKCRCAIGHMYRACACSHALSHLEVCGKNRGFMCCRVLCGCGYGTWMLQDNRTLFCSKKVCCMRSAEWSQEVEKAKTYRIGAKSKFLFNVFNLQAVLYYCSVFNLVVNYPIL